MLSLNLARIRTAQERFNQVYEPRLLVADQDAFTVVAPVTLGFDIYKDKDQFRLAGRVQTTLEMPWLSGVVFETVVPIPLTVVVVRSPTVAETSTVTCFSAPSAAGGRGGAGGGFCATVSRAVLTSPGVASNAGTASATCWCSTAD